MAGIEISQRIGDLLKDLPSNHPDRRKLQAFYRSLITERSKSDKGATFSPETKSKLVDNGYLIYPLSGLSVAQLVLLGKPFAREQREWINNEFTLATYKKTQVAISSTGFIGSTFGKSLDDQKRAVEYEFKASLSRLGINGVRTIIGTPAQYAQIIFDHYEGTGGDLLAGFPLENRSLNSCLTEPLVGARGCVSFVLVCSGSAARVSFLPSMSISSSYGHSYVGVIPLIVPEGY